MAKWLYMTNDAYDMIGKVDGNKVKVFIQDQFFPNIVNMDEDEKQAAIEKFMEGVIESDYSEAWDKYPIEELEGNDILWEKEIPTSITEIRAISGLNRTKFAEKYGIPYRTIQDWEAGKSKPPAYVLPLLERCVREDFKEER